MDSRIILRVLAVALALSFGACGAALADTITFDGLTAFTPYNPYVEKGFRFTNDDTTLPDPARALASWGVGNSFSADLSSTSATLFNNAENSTTTLARVGGGAFDLTSIDFAYGVLGFSDTPFDVVFHYVGGTSFTLSTALDLTVAGLQSFVFDQHNLLSVTWQPTSTNGGGVLQWDNVNVTPLAATTPIPAALPLFVSALGMLGFAAWRKRRAPASPSS
jgi:hypothetical protein